MDGTSLHPDGPRIPYNPFDCYWPQGQATRHDRSLPYLFLDVDPTNIQQVVAFSERFGVLGDTQRSWASWKKEDQRNPVFLSNLFPNFPITQEDKRRDAMIQQVIGDVPNAHLPKRMTLDDFEREQGRVRDIIRFVRQTEAAPTPQKKADARATLREYFAGALENVRPSLQWDDRAEAWITGWDILTLMGAIYLMLLFDVQGRGHILTCPWCNRPFLGDHPRTVFCSPRCQNSDKVHRYRERLAKQKASQEAKSRKKRR